MLKSLKKVFTKEYLLFLAIGFLPLLYKILQITFLNTFENAIKIVGQMVFIELLFKIFQETITNPLFKVLGKNDNSEENKNFHAKRFLILYSLLCAAFSLMVFFLIVPIMHFSKVPSEIFDSTKTFLQLMVFANALDVVVQYLFSFNVISKKTKSIFVYFLIGSAVMLLLNVILIPKFALGLGIIGFAVSVIIVNAVKLVYFVLTMPKTKNVEVKALDKRQYLKLSLLSFLETLTRNLTYYFIILVLLNVVNNQELYFVGNEFIWSVMLVPVLAQNNCIKQSVSINNNESLKPYFVNGILISLYICVMLPVAFLLFRYVFAFANYMDYFMTLLKLVPCYFIFIFDNVIESYFIATGKMNFVFIQTLITNIAVYLTSFIFYICGVWQVTLNSIILVFSAGMILSSAYTIIVYVHQKRKHNRETTQSSNLHIDKVDVL